MDNVSRYAKYFALILIGINIFIPPAAAEIGIMDNKLISGAFIVPDNQQRLEVLMSANNPDGNIPVYDNTALSNDGWVNLGDALPNLPGWAQAGKTWRPSLINVNGTYLLYFSAINARTGNHCIGVASSTTVTGPFSNQKNPLICVQGSEVIDPYPFLDDNGQLYLTWKQGGNMAKVPPIVYITPLGPNGLKVTAGTPRSSQLISLGKASMSKHRTC